MADQPGIHITFTAEGQVQLQRIGVDPVLALGLLEIAKSLTLKQIDQAAPGTRIQVPRLGGELRA